MLNELLYNLAPIPILIDGQLQYREEIQYHQPFHQFQLSQIDIVQFDLKF